MFKPVEEVADIFELAVGVVKFLLDLFVVGAFAEEHHIRVAAFVLAQHVTRDVVLGGEWEGPHQGKKQILRHVALNSLFLTDHPLEGFTWALFIDCVPKRPTGIVPVPIRPTLNPPLANEAKLIAAAKRDPRLFAPLYEHYFEEVFRFVWSRVKDKDLAADLTSQTFSKALSAIGKYKHRGVGLGAWLMRIAINEVNMHFRQAKRRAEVPLGPQVVDRLLDEFEQGNHSDHQRQRLINGLNSLNEEQVMLIELRYFEGRRFAEMGALLAISEDNAKVRTYRALSALKKAIFASDA